MHLLHLMVPSQSHGRPALRCTHNIEDYWSAPVDTGGDAISADQSLAITKIYGVHWPMDVGDPHTAQRRVWDSRRNLKHMAQDSVRRRTEQEWNAERLEKLEKQGGLPEMTPNIIKGAPALYRVTRCLAVALGHRSLAKHCRGLTRQIWCEYPDCHSLRWVADALCTRLSTALRRS